MILAGLRRLEYEYEIMSGIDARRDIAAMEAADIARQEERNSEGRSPSANRTSEVLIKSEEKASIEDLNAEWSEFKRGVKDGH